MYTYTYTYTHAYIYIYTCPHTYTHTHIYTHTYQMYICTHASTPGTTARQRLREELMQTQEALHVSFVRRNHIVPKWGITNLSPTFCRILTILPIYFQLSHQNIYHPPSLNKITYLTTKTKSPTRKHIPQNHPHQ